MGLINIGDLKVAYKINTEKEALFRQLSSGPELVSLIEHWKEQDKLMKNAKGKKQTVVVQIKDLCETEGATSGKKGKKSLVCVSIVSIWCLF